MTLADSFRREIDSGGRGAGNERFAAIVSTVMRARNLHSSMIRRVLFDEDAGTLSIWFRQSGRYIYYGVPRAIYDALVRAASAGAFFNACIKGRFECRADPERRRFRPHL